MPATWCSRRLTGLKKQVGQDGFSVTRAVYGRMRAVPDSTRDSEPCKACIGLLAAGLCECGDRAVASIAAWLHTWLCNVVRAAATSVYCTERQGIITGEHPSTQRWIVAATTAPRPRSERHCGGSAQPPQARSDPDMAEEANHFHQDCMCDAISTRTRP